MTTRAIFDIYDLSSPMVTPTAPKPATQARPYLQRLAECRTFNASVILAVFASAVYSIGTVLSLFPVGAVLPSEDFGLWLGVIVGGLAAAGVITALLAAAVLGVRP